MLRKKLKEIAEAEQQTMGDVSRIVGEAQVHQQTAGKSMEEEGKKYAQLLDDANNRHLLSALSPFASRTARYVCAAAFASEQWELASRGETTGEITQVARGNMGFEPMGSW